jgi:hypothetical protein
MYPQRELTALAACKVSLRRDIAVRRAWCKEAAIGVARPLKWLDRVLAFLHRIPPAALFAAVPLGFLVKRSLFPRAGILGMLLRWGPLAFGAARLMNSAAKARPAPVSSPRE